MGGFTNGYLANSVPEKPKLEQYTKEIEDSSVNVLCCFEVLEHLYHYESNKFYTEAKRILHSNGACFIHPKK
ncbi:MAG: methyltransferase domain-containing protein [Candidatus Electrothrix sp. LOE1_4_5]|nr:methyltransferase domain-containing protein [Candidatus Electrothrix gigas]